MWVKIILPLVIFTFIWIPNTAMACSPPPWSFEILSKDAKAILFGKAVSVTNDGRTATLGTTAYAGPGEAPKKVILPSTIDSRVDKQDRCGDLSTKFSDGTSYIVFLADVPPNLQLAGKSSMDVSTCCG